jgi:hypothetical protein
VKGGYKPTSLDKIGVSTKMNFSQNTGSTASRGSKYNGGSNMAYITKGGNQNVQTSQSPPSVRNKVQGGKGANKNSNQKMRDPHN